MKMEQLEQRVLTSAVQLQVVDSENFFCIASMEVV